MNKFFKYGLLAYGTLIVAKTVEVLLNNIKLAQQQQEEIHGYMVLRDTGFMKTSGMAVAAVVIFTDGTKKIVVDDSFFEISPLSQQAILAHEEGHIVLEHLDNVNQLNVVKRSLISATGGVQAIELEADAYAASQVGHAVMISALSELLIKVNRINKKEIRNRIAILQKNM